MGEIRKEIIRPQAGYQLNSLSNKADIVIGGASAGVGKTYSLLLDPLKFITTVKDFGGVIFRRTTPQIRNQGGLWDTSFTLYSKIPNTKPKESVLEWSFANGNKIKFSHLEHEKNKYDWQGSQIPFIGFDELTHFSKDTFFYLLSRNRSVCGIKPYVRCTCNPEPESWVAELISWWIDQETGFPIPERNCKIRYFLKNSESYIWGDSYDEVYEKSKFFLDELIEKSKLNPNDFIKSIAFVSGSIYENKKLLEVNPEYLSNLMALDTEERNKLMYGNWKVIDNDFNLYKHAEFNGMFNNVFNCKSNDKRIIADIALHGSNKLAIGYFEGRSLEDIIIMDRSDGKEVISAIELLAKKYRVPNNKILFDADGVGAYISGYLRGSIPFHGGSAVIPCKDTISGKIIKENYANLKTQLYYHSANCVNNNEYHISENVYNQMYDNKHTIKQRFNFERKAIKKHKLDSDGKKTIIPKEVMKTYLNNDSPDLMDMLMMNEYFELNQNVELTVFAPEYEEPFDY